MQHLGRSRLALVAVVVAALGACSAAPGPPPSGTSTGSPTSAAACQSALDRVVAAVQEQVRSYDTAPAPTANATSTATASSTALTPSATDSPTQATSGTDLAEALTAAREVIVANRCDQQSVTSGLTAKLAGVQARGPIATAVLARLTATITGNVGPTPIAKVVAPGEDLSAIITQTPGGVHRATVRRGASPDRPTGAARNRDDQSGRGAIAPASCRARPPMRPSSCSARGASS